MKVILKLAFLVTITALFFVKGYLTSSATEIGGIRTTDTYVIPEEFNVQSSDMCTGHDFYYQAAAREDGWYAIYYRNTDKNTDEGIRLAYIDIFNSDCEFMQELSFTTPHDFIMELTDRSINLYFYNYIIVYDLNTGNLEGYVIPGASAINSDRINRLRKSEFTVGKWEYKCKKSLYGYTELIRTNGSEKQILTSLNGYSFFPKNIMILGVVLGCSCVYLIKKRKSRH